jgi:restriction system protein
MPETFSGSAGALRLLTSPNLDLPLDELRKYLAAQYESRFAVHPRLFEETVASVFRDLGYRTRVTGYSHDDGIDVVMDGPGDQIIGVQVKRWKNSVTVEQIRAFAGALILGGMTKGMFVTTSGFQSGVPGTAGRFAARGIPIELLNAQRFYDALRVAQINRYQAHQIAVEALLSVPVTVFTQQAGACSDKHAIPAEQWILPSDGILPGGMRYIRPSSLLNTA